MFALKWAVGLQISQLWCCHQRQGCLFFFFFFFLWGLQCLCSCTVKQIGEVICLKNNLFFFWAVFQQNLIVQLHSGQISKQIYWYTKMVLWEWMNEAAGQGCHRCNSILKYLLNFSLSSDKNVCLFSVEKWSTKMQAYLVIFFRIAFLQAQALQNVTKKWDVDTRSCQLHCKCCVLIMPYKLYQVHIQNRKVAYKQIWYLKNMICFDGFYIISSCKKDPVFSNSLQVIVLLRKAAQLFSLLNKTNAPFCTTELLDYNCINLGLFSSVLGLWYFKYFRFPVLRLCLQCVQLCVNAFHAICLIWY